MTEITPEDNYTLDLAHKDFKTTVLNNFKMLMENMDKKETEGNQEMMCGKK